MSGACGSEMHITIFTLLFLPSTRTGTEQVSPSRSVQSAHATLRSTHLASPENDGEIDADLRNSLAETPEYASLDWNVPEPSHVNHEYTVGDGVAGVVELVVVSVGCLARVVGRAVWMVMTICLHLLALSILVVGLSVSFVWFINMQCACLEVCPDG